MGFGEDEECGDVAEVEWAVVRCGCGGVEVLVLGWSLCSAYVFFQILFMVWNQRKIQFAFVVHISHLEQVKRALCS